MNLLRKPFDAWVSLQNAAVLAAASQSPRIRLGIDLFAIALVLLTGLGPGGRLFEVDVGWALLAYAPHSLNGWVAVLRWRARPLGVDRNTLATFFVGVATQLFFLSVLVARSTLAGAAVFGPLVLFTATYQGNILRSGPRQPFVALATLIAVAAAMPLCRQQESQEIVAAIGFISMVASMIVGAVTIESDRRLAAQASMVSALQAQMLHEEQGQEQNLLHRLQEISTQAHDLNNSLNASVSAAGSVELLLEHVERHLAPEARGSLAELIETARDLETALQHSTQLVEQLRSTAMLEEVSLSREAVSVDATLQQTLRHLKSKLEPLTLEVKSPSPPIPKVLVVGGEATVRRILENLLLNAAQGDGERVAKVVKVAWSVDPSGAQCELVVADDGPGFSHSMLAQPITGFRSSKPHGTGLGLYTTERLVAVSGGRLERMNTSPTGALIRVLLPLEGR